MQAAGIDTHEVLRRGMAAFTEGCMVHGIFHGDLHGGNLFIAADGRIALLDFGITARMTDLERTAFMRLMLSGAMGDIRGQIAAFRDLGALPPDTDIDDVIAELGLDQQPIDPTKLSQEELRRRAAAHHQGAAGHGRTAAEDPDALRQEPGVPGRRDRQPGARPGPDQRVRQPVDPPGGHPRRPLRRGDRRLRGALRGRPGRHPGQLRHRRRARGARSPTASCSVAAS